MTPNHIPDSAIAAAEARFIRAVEDPQGTYPAMLAAAVALLEASGEFGSIRRTAMAIAVANRLAAARRGRSAA